MITRICTDKNKHYHFRKKKISSRGNMGSNPCLICKHLGKPCFGNCEFGQYFPANREEEFANACRHFGISNILRNMRVVQPHERQATAKSLLIESTIRRNDPVRGCLGVVLDLQSELETLNKLLKFYRDQACPSNLNTSTTSIIPAPSNPSVIASSTQIPTLAESVRHAFLFDPNDYFLNKILSFLIGKNMLNIIFSSI